MAQHGFANMHIQIIFHMEMLISVGLSTNYFKLFSVTLLHKLGTVLHYGRYPSLLRIYLDILSEVLR